MRPWCLGVVSLLLACTSASAPKAVRTKDEPAASKPPNASSAAAKRKRERARYPSIPRDQSLDFPVEGLSSCEAREAHYLAVRDRENRCERDDECAEIYPGLCPHGPYYMNVAGDHEAIAKSAKRVGQSCEVPECEMPMPLGIGHCEEGRCVRGRTPPEDGPKSSCWDTKVTYMKPGHPYLASSYEHLQGITPLHAVGVPAAGTLRLSAKLGCTDCAPELSEHNLGMARRVKGKAFTPGPKDPMKVEPVTSRAPPPGDRWVHREFPVTPGPYFLATLGGTPGEVQYQVTLLDAKGELMQPDRLGRVHVRVCED